MTSVAITSPETLARIGARWSVRAFAEPNACRPHAQAECHVLLIEPGGTVNTGVAGSAMTAANGVWL